jgi:SacI homology domain
MHHQVSPSLLGNYQSAHAWLLLQNVVAVSLVNLHGSEGVLARAFQDQVDRFNKTASGLRLVAFDFHQECGASRYHK